MQYKVTYIIETGEVVGMEPITTATIELEDGETFERWINGQCRCRIVDGALEEDTSEVPVEQNVVPEGETVGIPIADYEEQYGDGS